MTSSTAKQQGIGPYKLESRPTAPVVKGLYVGKVAGEPMEPREEVLLIAGVGIEGDRYAGNRGTFVRRKGRGMSEGLALTLIEEEAVEAARLEHGLELEFTATRRNIVTAGLRLDDLVGKDFRIGASLVRGVALNPPCSRLEKLAGIAGLKKALAGRGGIRADVLEGGRIRVGDRVVPV